MQPIEVARSLSAQWPFREVQAQQLATLFTVGAFCILASDRYIDYYGNSPEKSVLAELC